ncbi:MAG TPA: helix-turn-helix domain-containing protein [Mycobacterium sp.]|nr:helix-turn-helix domain-containing protein [Mycobacterium sp.]
MHEQLAAVSSVIRRSLEEEIPELRGDARIVELHGASVEGNVDTLLHALRYGIAVERVEAPTAALEFARRLAQHGVPVNALVRAYRLGQRRMNELVFREVGVIDVAAPVRLSVLEAITATLFEYIDWISQQVVAVYEEERERWLENQNSLRGLRVRELLTTTQAIDVDAATASIRYPLRWHHLAVVMWCPDGGVAGDELSRLQRFLRDLAQAADASAIALFVAADQTSGWAWLPYRSAPPSGVVEIVRHFARGRPNSPSVAIGTVLPGVEGFRRSHRSAEAARGVAVTGGHRAPAVISATDPGLSAAALLCGRMDDAREWVTEVLGDLSADSENDARLRETLRVFLRCGSSYKLAAEELDLHFNSVKYRVGRAVVRRGRPFAGDRLDVEMALLATEWFGTAVLQSDGRV